MSLVTRVTRDGVIDLRDLLRRAVAIVSLIALLGTIGLPGSRSAAAQESAGERGSGTPSSRVDPAALKDEGNVPDVLAAPGLSKGVDAIIAEIRKREVDLAVREQRVAERERAVVELEQLIEKRSIDLDRIRQEVEDRIAEWTAQGPDRVTQLASVYSSMPAERAGELLGRLDLDLAVAVVRNMKKKSSAGVLAAMRPDRALQLSRRILKPLDPGTDAPAAPRN